MSTDTVAATAHTKPARSTRQRLAHTGVPNPYALAELLTGRRIDWANVADRHALLEDIFQTPYRDLFDPANGSPLYIGQSVQADGSVRRARPDWAALRAADAPPAGPSSVELVNDAVAEQHAAHGNRADVRQVRSLSDLVKQLGSGKPGDVPIRRLVDLGSSVVVEFGETTAARDLRFSRIFDRRLIDILFPLGLGYHPDGMNWEDTGRFYNEATEFLDPIQGAVGDCYLIAALSSVAWSLPFTIGDRTRATGMDNESFVHQIGFHGSKGLELVEVTDRVLVAGSNPQFARSKEAGETWPALYEKAFAKWRLDEPTDYPAIPTIAGGDPSEACAQLTGLAAYRNWHDNYSTAQILQLVKSHSVDGRTTTPMVAWTFDTGTGHDVDYADADVVANHAYSVLGWMRRLEWRTDQVFVPDLVEQVVTGPIIGPGPVQRSGSPATVASLGRAEGAAFPARRSDIDAVPLSGLFGLSPRWVDYVVLRNPWGTSEATGSAVAAGTDVTRDISWWRSIPLGVDGVFAMEINAFHHNFAGTGGAQ